MKRLGFTISFFLMGATLQAQDIHFTQFFATPLFTNPAFTGHFDGTYRFSGIIRNQWASISSQPYSTFGGGVDVNGPFGLKPMGVGIQIARDQAGLSFLTTNQVNLTIAGKIPLAPKLKLHLGVTPGVFQETIDYSLINFGDQYDGTQYDPQRTTAETLPQGPVVALNVSAGTYLEYRMNERQRVGIGYGLFNLNQPNQSFFQRSESLLPRRHNIHMLSSFPIGAKWDLMPAFQFQQQGEQSELLLGSAIRLHLAAGPLDQRSIQLGIWGRTADALNISAGLQMNDLYLGGAYDFNLSDLQPATGYRGGWEFALIYTIATVKEKVKRLRQCPDYL